MRQLKSIQILGQAVPFVMSFTMVSLIVSCGSSNGGKQTINKTGGAAAATAANATVKTAFANFNESAAQNVTLSSRVEGASMTVQYANAIAGTGVSATSTTSSTATSNTVKQFSIVVKILVDDDDSTKPAFIVSVADTINANAAVAAAAAPSATGDDSDGVVRASGVDTATSSATADPSAATVDSTPTPATPTDSTAQAAASPNVKRASLAFASDSSPGVSTRFRVFAKCADADCATVNILLKEIEASADSTVAGYDAKTQTVRRQTVRSFKNVVVDTKRLANEEHDMRVQYTAPTALPTTTTTPGTPGTPLTPQQRARGTKTNPTVTTVHRPGAALTPAFSDAMTARQKAGLPISGMSDDSSTAPTAASTPTPAQTPAPAASSTVAAPQATSSTAATAPVTPVSAAPAAPATTDQPAPITAAPADDSAAAPAAAETYVGSEGPPEMEAQPPSAGNVR